MKGDNSIFRNAFFNILYKITNIAFPIITAAYCARVLPVDGLGKISYVQNNASYFLLLASLGIPAYGLREIAKYRDNKEKQNEIFSDLLAINFIFTSVSVIIYIVCLYAIPYFRQERLLYTIFGIPLILNFLNIDWLYQGVEEYSYIATRNAVVKIASLILTIILIRDSDDIYTYAMILSIFTSLNYILNIVHVRKYIKFRKPSHEIRMHMKPLLYLSLSSISTVLYAQMDITMLGFIKGHSSVAYYTYSQKIIFAFVTLMTTITGVFFPRLSYYFQSDKKGFNRLISLGLNFNMLISIPTCIGIIFLAEPLILLYLGTDYMSAVSSLSILAFMLPLKSIGDLVCYQVMMSAGQELKLMVSYIITCVVNFINNIIMIPQMGALGASIASVISELIVFMFVFYYSRNYFQIEDKKSFVKNTSAVITGTLLMSLWLVGCNNVLDNIYIHLIVGFIVSVVIYFVTNIAFGNTLILDFLLRRKSE